MTRALPAAAVLLSLTLTGCMTPRVKPEPSLAVQEVRARAAAEKARLDDPCSRYSFAPAAPVRVFFAYNKAQLSEETDRLLEGAAVWLLCHPDIPATVSALHDNQGTPADQQALIAARIAAVRNGLTEAGVPAARVLTARPVQGQALSFEARGRGW